MRYSTFIDKLKFYSFDAKHNSSMGHTNEILILNKDNEVVAIVDDELVGRVNLSKLDVEKGKEIDYVRNLVIEFANTKIKNR